jgi:cation:H+ antiporter
MLAHAVWFVLGLVALLVGADALVRGASRATLSLGISPLVVGLTVVAFGTSAPELAVSVGAALHGVNDIAVGNVLGSNIFNVLAVLGISALVVPLTVHTQLIRQEVPIMIGASLLLIVVTLDGRLSRGDGAVLLGLLVVYTVLLVRQSRAQPRDTQEIFEEALDAGSGWERHWWVQALLIVGGLALLVVGANWLVDASVAFAHAFGISDLVVGLTIIAAGTSMPELATTVVAALRGERDIAIGHVIGSNTFNILGVLGASALSAPAGLTIAVPAMHFDIWVMGAVALACLPMFIEGREIGRAKALLFVAYYFAYVAYLIFDAQGHDALPQFSAIMIGFVLPITIVTLIAMVLRERASADVV